jgi:EAL and modified HD-GYP domain-containing signal transduction protein
MDQPLPDLIANLPLSEDITSALLVGEGDLGLLLSFSSNYENGNWPEEARAIVTLEEANHAYLGALRWASDITHQIS